MTASEDRTARIWDARTGRERLVLTGHSEFVNDVAFSPDGLRIATASEDKTVRIWDVSTGRGIATLKGHERFVTNVSFNSSGTGPVQSKYEDRRH